MKRKTDFEIMCDRLANPYYCNVECEKNEINCVREEIEKYIAGDKNRMLKLKVEAEYSLDSFSANSSVINAYSLLLVALSLIVDISGFQLIGIIALIIILFFGLYALYITRKNKSISKWRKYIIVVLKEYE